MSTIVSQPRSSMAGVVQLRLDCNECVDDATDLGIMDVPSTAGVARYPETTDLERLIASRSGTDPSRIVVTAGADDAIDRVCTAFLDQDSKVLMTEPTFVMIRRSIARRSSTVESLPWLDGRFPLEDFTSRSDGCDLMVVVTPCNPTGRTISLEQLEAIRSGNPDPILMVDLAYIEFSEDGADTEIMNTLAAIRRMPKTVMVRTLSKAWGLAGLRIGWTESSPDLADRIREAGGPYAVSSMSIQVAGEALSDPVCERLMRRRVDRVVDNRRRMERWMGDRGFDSGDSEANFLLVQDPLRRGRTDRLASGLRSLGIAVRRFDESSVRDRIRITVPPDRIHMDRLRRCVDAVVDPDVLLFDLDGVIADVDRSYRSAIENTVAEFGFDVGEGEIDRMKRKGGANDDWDVTRRILLDRGVEVDVDEIVRRFQCWYLGDESRDGLCELETPLIDPTTIGRVAGDRRVGIVTGRPRVEADRFLERFGFDRVIDAVVAREDAPLKPDPTGLSKALRSLDARSAWFFGDTVDDVMAATRQPSGLIVPIGVTDDDSRTSLEAAGAAWIVPRGEGIAELAEEVIS